MCTTHIERSAHCGHIIAQSQDTCELRGPESFCENTVERRRRGDCSPCKQWWRREMEKEMEAMRMRGGDEEDCLDSMPSLRTLQWSLEQVREVSGGVDGHKRQDTPGKPDTNRKDAAKKVQNRGVSVPGQKQARKTNANENTPTRVEKPKPDTGLLGSILGATKGKGLEVLPLAHKEQGAKGDGKTVPSGGLAKEYKGLFRSIRAAEDKGGSRVQAPGQEPAPQMRVNQDVFCWSPLHKTYKGVFAPIPTVVVIRDER